MNEDGLRIVIIDDNVIRRNQIKSFLPTYVDALAFTYGEEARNALLPDEDGEVADLVIINGDDDKGKGLYTYDWMKTKANNIKTASIPVIVLTEDEFSDRSLDFLEIGDVTFYEGEIDEYSIFDLITVTIEEYEFKEEEFEPLYTDAKSYDKVLGLSLKPVGENSENKRSVALDMESKLSNLEAAIERGRQKTMMIKELIDAAVEQKSVTRSHAPHFLNKVRIDNGLEPIEEEIDYEEPNIKNQESKESIYKVSYRTYEGEPNPLLAGLDDIDDSEMATSKTYEGEIDPLLAGLDEIEDGERVRVYDSAVVQSSRKDFTRSLEQMGKKLREQPQDTLSAHTIKIKDDAPRKTIVVVDDNAEDRESCELYLSTKYDVVLLDNGMAAVDYFSEKTADMILLDTYMPNLGGVQTLESVRITENGRNVPVVYMMDKRFPVYVESLSGNGVIGVLQKPIKMGGLAMAVDGYFRSRK